ncbi:MAG TPA: LytTR family DNA-binding domain-containing protein [Gemmatimonas sp.]|nr:LytTR family DNA-binding domain-containing protein [Gemmatimonas sp.]
MLRTLIVDDEPLARRRLRAMLALHADVEVIAEREDADSAVAAIRELRPSLVFLDLQMPGGDGFSVLARAHVTPAPFVVVATAHAQHAVHAFDVDAGDYLLKPFDEGRLARALERARAANDQRQTQAIVRPDYLQRVTSTVGRRTIILRMADVEWIGADGNYAVFHVHGKPHLVRTTLGALVEALDPNEFARIHRSVIVRIDAVRELLTASSGEQHVVLMSGQQLPMTARFRDRLRLR